MLKVGVLVSGGGTNLQAMIDAIQNNKIKNAEIVTVVSNRKDAYALERAEMNGISAKCLRPRDYENKELFSQALILHMQNCDVDLIVMAGYLVVLSESFIEAFAGRIINIHPSLIPSFCGDGFYGLKVHEEVLRRGVKITGATVHFVDEGTDTGPILLQKAVEVYPDDTAEILQKRVMEQAEWVILPQAIHAIANNLVQWIDGKVEIVQKAI